MYKVTKIFTKRNYVTELKLFFFIATTGLKHEWAPKNKTTSGTEVIF